MATTRSAVPTQSQQLGTTVCEIVSAPFVRSAILQQSLKCQDYAHRHHRCAQQKCRPERALHQTRIIAADIGVRAPHAASAGLDPLGTMRMEKHFKYAAHRDDLAVQGLAYEPLMFSAFGRRHPRATDMLHLAASKFG